MFITGGSKQGLKINDLLKVLKYGQKVKSEQSRFSDSPSGNGGCCTLKVTSFFGESEVDEGSRVYPSKRADR